LAFGAAAVSLLPRAGLGEILQQTLSRRATEMIRRPAATNADFLVLADHAATQ
jgi:hypothetical protein